MAGPTGAASAGPVVPDNSVTLDNLRRANGGDGGSEQKNIFEMVVEGVGPKVMRVLAKYTGVDASTPENAVVSKSANTNGLPDAKLPGLAVMNNGQAGGPFAAIYNALKMLISNSKIDDHTGGISASAIVENATPIEAMDPRTLVADIGPLNLGSGGAHFETGSLVSPSGGGNSGPGMGLNA